MTYPENIFEFLLSTKIIDKNWKAVIKSNKYDIIEDVCIQFCEEDNLESNPKLEKLKEKQQKGSRKNKSKHRPYKNQKEQEQKITPKSNNLDYNLKKYFIHFLVFYVHTTNNLFIVFIL